MVRGTRLSVAFMIGLLADGWSETEILADYPGLTHDDITACLACARDLKEGPERRLTAGPPRVPT